PSVAIVELPAADGVAVADGMVTVTRALAAEETAPADVAAADEESIAEEIVAAEDQVVTVEAVVATTEMAEQEALETSEPPMIQAPDSSTVSNLASTGPCAPLHAVAWPLPPSAVSEPVPQTVDAPTPESLPMTGA